MADLIEEVAGGGAVPHRREAALLSDLRAALPQTANGQVALVVRKADALAAGLGGATSYGWPKITSRPNASGNPRRSRRPVIRRPFQARGPRQKPPPNQGKIEGVGMQ